MNIHAVSLRRLELRLVHEVKTSTETHDRRPILIVEVESDIGRGVGECSALAEPNYTEEYADGAEKVLVDHFLPQLLALGASDHSVDELMASLYQSLGDAKRHPMALAAIEMALFDIQLRFEKRSLAEFVGATKDRIPAGATIGIGLIDDIVRETAVAVSVGYRRIKLKIAPGRALPAIGAVRAAFPSLELSVDANGAYDFNDEEHRRELRALDDFGLLLVEQPLPVHDLVNHAALRRLLETPVVLDESISSPETLELALEQQAMDGVSIKPGRVGGIASAVAIHDRCIESGVHLCIGGLFETGLGRAAALAVAAMAGFDLPGDLGASDRYFVADITAPHALIDGWLLVPKGPGIGVELLPEVIEQLTTRLLRF